MKTNKKRSLLSKLMALCLGVAMLLTSSVGVSAASISSSITGSFYVEGLDTDKNVEVSAYQIITVNVDDDAAQPENPMYQWADGIVNWVSDNYSQYIDVKNDNAVKDAFGTVDGAEMTTFLEEMTAAIMKDSLLVPTKKVESQGSASVNFTEMAMGEYLLTAKGGVKIYKPTTVKLVPEYKAENKEWVIGGSEIGTAGVMKGEDPGIQKEVEKGDTTVAIGDTVTYILTVDVPSYPADAVAKTFTIGDKLSTGLTYNDNVKVYEDKECTNVIANTNYTNESNPEDKTFELSFTSDFLNTTTLTKVYVKYTATVNENAFGADALGNSAFLGYNNDPYNTDSFETETTEEDVYTYGINVTKFNEEETERLSGAQFTLTKDGDSTPLTFTEKTGTDGVYNYDRDAESAVLEVSSDGVLQIQGLDQGTYVLKETKAPAGYVLPNGKVTIVITDADGTGANGVIDSESVTVEGNINVPTGENDITINRNVISLKVLNTSGLNFELPKTGGMGTVLFTVGGILLMGGAVVVILLAKKKKAE